MDDSLHFTSDVGLRDGSIVRVAPAGPQDGPALGEFLHGLSAAAIEMRFNGPVADRTPLLKWLMPGPDSFGLLAWHGGKVVAHANYHVVSPGVAETGLLVADDFTGKGLGTILLGQLAERADEEGIFTFQHAIAPDNQRMLDVIRNTGFPLTQKFEKGLVKITHPTSLSQDVVERFALREAMANARAVSGFLKPTSLAVIGAARERGTIGGELFHNCLSGGFSGPVYPVNPNAEVVQSVLAYPSVLDCPGPVDLAIACVPASVMLQVAEQCGQKGVHSLLVISAGFAEASPEGRELQADLVDICRQHGMRLIGPNCMGIANTAPGVHLNGQFSTLRPLPGDIGILSQSGAVGLALIDYSNNLGHGMSSFVSVGNKADISGNDLLNYWEVDEATRLILLYLESFGNPRKFSRIARRVARKKPIVVVKGGRSPAGFRATQSHTGALVSTSSVTVEALFRQSGVIRVDTLEEMFDIAALLDSQPVPKGKNVAIITNAGGAGILAADACGNVGLQVPELSETTTRALRSFLRPDASVRNPVDMVASATVENYARTIQVIAKEPGIDAIVVIFIPPLTLKATVVADVIVEAARELHGSPSLVGVLMASKELPSILQSGDVKVPSFQFPEAAVSALAKAAEYGTWLSRPEEPAVVFEDIDKARAAAIVGSELTQGDHWLAQDKVQALLDCYHIPTAKAILVDSGPAAGTAAAEMGGKVVLKALAPKLLHKRDVGAVALGLEGAESVSRTATEMTAKLAKAGFPVTGFMVQEMLGNAIEMIVGVTHDSTFGPVVACGGGGTLVELIHDVSVRLAPMTGGEADEMISSLKTFQLLNGYRGSGQYDVAALRDLLLRVGRMADELQGIMELDLNPVMVLPEGRGLAVVDARVRVAEAAPEIPIGAKKR